MYTGLTKRNSSVLEVRFAVQRLTIEKMPNCGNEKYTIKMEKKCICFLYCHELPCITVDAIFTSLDANTKYLRPILHVKKVCFFIFSYPKIDIFVVSTFPTAKLIVSLCYSVHYSFPAAIFFPT